MPPRNRHRYQPIISDALADGEDASQVERSFDGQIAEIVYKGEHNHPKPQPPKHLATVSEEHGSESGGSLLGSAYNGSVDSEAGLTNGDYKMGNTTSSINNDRHKPKRRKHKEPVSGEGMVSQHVRDPESLVQTSAEELHVLGDGFRWRKYGQKVDKRIHIQGVTTDVPISNATFASTLRGHRMIQDLSSQRMRENTTTKKCQIKR